MPITPQRNETEADFVERFHNEFQGGLTEERNAVCREAWQKVHGLNSADHIADLMFGDKEKFTTKKNVVIFSEHEREDDEGNHQVYDRDALEKIVGRCNDRISDRETFGVLTDGHTPTTEQKEKGMAQPGVLGFCGPYRLGKIGHDKPLFCILADEHYRNEHLETVKALPRRSVELWLAEDMEDRFFDPIAALGAETPHLDLGLRFGMLDGAKVTKYAKAVDYAGAYPGGANVFVTNHEDKERNQMEQGASSPETVKQVIAALMEWGPFKEFMESQQQQPANPLTGEMGEQPARQPLPQPPKENNGMPYTKEKYTESSVENEGDLANADSAEYMHEEDEDEDKKKDDYDRDDMDDEHKEKCEHKEGDMKDKDRKYPLRSEERAAKSSRGEVRELRLRQERYEKALGETQRELKSLKHEKRSDAMLAELKNLRYSREFDVEKEHEHCMTLDESGCEAHYQRIEENYRETPTNARYFHTPNVEQEDHDRSKARREGDTEKARLQLSNRAKEIGIATSQAGESISYEKALEQAKKEAKENKEQK